MPEQFAESWEYYTPDPEVAEAMAGVEVSPALSLFDFDGDRPVMVGVQVVNTPGGSRAWQPADPDGPDLSRHCRRCGKPVNNPRSLHCSRACAALDTHERRGTVVLPRACFCGAVLVPLKNRTRYCSKSCANRARYAESGLSPVPAAPGEQACPVCRGAVPQSGRKKVYCSRKCQRTANSRRWGATHVRTRRKAVAS